MKTMFISIPVGALLVLLAFSISAGLINLTAVQVAGLLAGVAFVIGGAVGLIDAWQNRPIQFRRMRKGRRG
jgi:heme/copper-type cytochrome/quinol oxidase subunit 1